MQDFYRILKSMAAMAVVGAVAMTGGSHSARAQAAASAPAAAPQKAVKDQQEFDLYNAVIKEVAGNDFKKALTDLDTWAQKYPDSAFKDERLCYYVMAYSGDKQPGKALDTTAQLLTKDLKTIAPDLVLKALYPAVVSGALITAATPGPTSEQLDAANKAAHTLIDFVKDYFAPAKKPAQVSEADWAAGEKQVEDQAKGTLLALAVYPANAKLKTNDKDPVNCAAAEPLYGKAVQEYPDSGQVALGLARALVCQQSATPAKAQQALYEFARVVVLPIGGLGGLDQKTHDTYDAYLKKIYTTFHGSEDGLDDLKALALKSPLPPEGFKVKSMTEIAAEKEQQFEKSNPQLAMWMRIKGALSDTTGEQYFADNMKDHEMKGENDAKLLKGTLVDGKPGCRSKDLLVAISDTSHVEVDLKLDKPLTGKPEAGDTIQWNGAPSAFTKEPFLLTMDVETAKIDGLKTSPCAAAPARPPAKKGVAHKKQ